MYRCTPPITTANQSPGLLPEVLSPSCDSGLWMTGGEGDGPGPDWVWGWVFLVVWVWWWWWWWCVVVKVTWPGEGSPQYGLVTTVDSFGTTATPPPPSWHTSITSSSLQDRLTHIQAGLLFYIGREERRLENQVINGECLVSWLWNVFSWVLQIIFTKPLHLSGLEESTPGNSSGRHTSNSILAVVIRTRGGTLFRKPDINQ